MAEIVKITKDGVIQYPITKPEAVIDENGKNVLQLILENGGSYDDTGIKKDISDLKIKDIEQDAELAKLSEEISKKQDTITDLATIRSGAAKGATAIQEVKTINGASILGSGNIVIQGGDVGKKDYSLLYSITIDEEVDELNILESIPTILENEYFIIETELVQGDSIGRNMKVHFYSQNRNYNLCSINSINKLSYQTHYRVRIRLAEDKRFESTCYSSCYNNSFGNIQVADGMQGLNLFGMLTMDSFNFNTFIIKFPFKIGDKIRIYGK